MRRAERDHWPAKASAFGVQRFLDPWVQSVDELAQLAPENAAD
jgi:hypothetical protein